MSSKSDHCNPDFGPSLAHRWLLLSSGMRPADGDAVECVLAVAGLTHPKMAAALFSVMLLSLFLTVHMLYDSAVYTLEDAAVMVSGTAALGRSRVHFPRTSRRLPQVWDVKCGFMPGRGYMGQIIALQQESDRCMAVRKKVYLTFVDLEQAYDVDALVVYDGGRACVSGGWKLVVYDGGRACVRVDGSWWCMMEAERADGSGNDYQLSVNGKLLEQVNDFVCLGRMFCKNRRMDNKINRRANASLRVAGSMWTSAKNAENEVISKEGEHKSKVYVVGMRYLRNVCGKTHMDKVSNEWMLRKLPDRHLTRIREKGGSTNHVSERQRSERWIPEAIIVGIRKCGTRALLEMLALHPHVQKAAGEVHFFDRDDNYRKGLEWYRRKMPHSFKEQITIEKSPSYFVTPECIRPGSNPDIPAFGSLVQHESSALDHVATEVGKRDPGQ
uniref:Sulfotransferase domain-containing protein n=1 Tax=Timema shepardi TaxID=629360 RepID=A0A7R9AU53_TIMSH|nr:unnamed protein product [Timema shepardi]